MKKIAIIILSFAFQFGMAQTNPDNQSGKQINRDWKNEVNRIFNPLDMDKVPHGLLLDRAMEFTNVPAYNGKLTDSTIVNVREMSNIFKTLAMARVKDTIMPTMETHAENWAMKRVAYNQEAQNTLVLSGFYFKYAKINENALRDNKISVLNNHYEDVYVNNVWQNPYDTLQTIAITPPIHRYNKNDFKIVLPRELWLSNSDILSISVDLGNGEGFKPLRFDEPLNVRYTDLQGTYRWTFKFELADGGSLLSATIIHVDAPEPNPLTNGITNVFIPHNNSPQSANKGAILRIDYAPIHNGQLTRPLIVAEGFDPGIITSPETEGGDRTLNDFLNDDGGIIDSGIELRNILTTNNHPNNNQQYDIVYVDWQNGTNDIRHNSEVFKNVIDWVNGHKQGHAQNVVLGQSMGGLIGRYTLAKMEQNNQTHDVRLFIAHDSPMQGSNVPLSAQYFTRHVNDTYVDSGNAYFFGEFIVPVIFDFADLMSSVINLTGSNLSINEYVSPESLLTIQDTPAAVQMNYHYVDPLGNARKNIHLNWQQQFDLMGYPTQCRNIAISNGSECAVDHGFEARDKFLNFHKNSGNYFWLLNSWVNSLGSAALGVMIGDPSLIFLGLLPGTSNYYYDFDIHSTPRLNNGNRHIYNGSIRYTKKVYWLVPITISLMNRNNSAPQGYEPFDIYSGGFYDFTTVTTQIDNTIPNTELTSSIVNGSYGFIPVVSALDIRRNNGPVIEDDYFRKYAGGASLPNGLTSGFESYTVGYDNGYFNNYKHISFQARNGNWLAAELNEAEYDDNCSFICDNNVISGINILCSSATYTVPSGAVSYTWIISGPATIVANGHSAVITRNGTSSGLLTIRVVINGGTCGTVSLEKEVWVGFLRPHNMVDINSDAFQHSYLSPSTDCGVDGFKVNFWPLDQQVLEYEWQKVTTNVAWNRDYAPDPSGNVFLYPTCNKVFTFKVRARNSCGWSEWFELTYEMNSCLNACNSPFTGIVGNNFILNPNPVTGGILNISVRNDAPWFFVEYDDNPLNPSIVGAGEGYLISPIHVNISIHNQLGILVQSNTSVLLPAPLDVSNLTPGSYIVTMHYMSQTENYTIIKN